MADVVIELKDGQHIVVPVDEKDVERITFSSNKDEAATAVVSPKLSSQVVWQVGPERVLKYPSEAARALFQDPDPYRQTPTRREFQLRKT